MHSQCLDLHAGGRYTGSPVMNRPNSQPSENDTR